MSYSDGWAALNLEMPSRVPRTEYSAEGHWKLIQAVTGIEVNENSPDSLKEKACAFFLMPVDIPFVQPGTIRNLLHAFDPEQMDILIPCFRGQRGHPPLLSSSLLPLIVSFEDAGGLRGMISKFGVRTQDWECRDPGILQDLDTWKDYQKALAIRKGL